VETAGLFGTIDAEPSVLSVVRINMIPIREFIFGTILASSLLTPASAAVIHKWIDADGITHYSDEAPAATPVTLIETTVPETAAKNDGYYTIANQWQRMRHERQQREKIILEKARLEAARQLREAPQPEVIYVQEPAVKRYSVYYPGLTHRRHGKYRSHRYLRHRGKTAGKHQHRANRASLGFFPTH